jgi:ATP-dependent Lon protease
VIAETVLPGEERAIDPRALDPTAVRYLEQAPSGIELALLPVTALAEVPLLAPGRYATRATWLGREDGSLRFSGQARVRIVAAKGTSAPFEADVQTSEMTHGDTGDLRRLVLLAAAAIAHGPPPIGPTHHAHVAAVAASLLRALDGGPGVRSALADGDLHSALESKTRSFVAASSGREALERIEEEVRALAEQPSLGKPLRQRLHSAIVEIARRLDIYDPNAYKDDGLDELDLLRQRLDQAGLPTATRVVVERELRLLRQMKPDHHDYTTHLRLLQLIGRLAWHAAPLPPVDLGRVKAVLDRDHTGLAKPKRRILEHLAVRALGGEGRSMVLCLAGPPGVGKTSIARAVAEALDRPFVRIALGGVHDEAELRGHRITYTGARPGRIIDGLAQAGSRSALVLLDELDKIGTDRQRSPVGALLEILDPEQNHAFSDNFLSVPYDLSDCLFLTTANELSEIPPYLLDRLEVIELDGYTTEEKVAIAKAHLGASLAKEHGIDPLEMSDETMAMVVEGWTREAGVRQLRRELATFYRQRAVERLLPPAEDEGAPPKNPSRPVVAGELTEVLGPPRHRPTERAEQPPPGVATGLSVSGHGGALLPIEVVRLAPAERPPGAFTMTGSLGKVMRESAETVRAYLLSHRDRYGLSLDEFSFDLHLHAPEAAVPKEGPSAGVALFLALLSLLSGIPVRPGVAVTGELSLSGQVLAVGGIRAKCLAAERAQMDLVLLPRKNEADVPSDLRIPVAFLDGIEDALQALVRPLEEKRR